MPLAKTGSMKKNYFIVGLGSMFAMTSILIGMYLCSDSKAMRQQRAMCELRLQPEEGATVADRGGYLIFTARGEQNGMGVSLEARMIKEEIDSGTMYRWRDAWNAEADDGDPDYVRVIGVYDNAGKYQVILMGGTEHFQRLEHRIHNPFFD